MATWSVRNVAIGESDFRNFSYWAIWYVSLVQQDLVTYASISCAAGM